MLLLSISNRRASPVFPAKQREAIEMDITGIAKSYRTYNQKTGKASSRKEWKLSDSLREQIAGYAREDAEQGVYMGNKFLALRKSEVAKAAPDRAGILIKQIGRQNFYFIKETLAFSLDFLNISSIAFTYSSNVITTEDPTKL